jgi:hypothetical protein
MTFQTFLTVTIALFLLEPFREPVDWKALGTFTHYCSLLQSACFSVLLSHTCAVLCINWHLGLYDYPQIIKRPIDLGTIKKKMVDLKYTSIPQVAEDVRTVWSNCMTYNADGSDFYLLAKNLSKKWDEKYAKLIADLQLDTAAGAPLNGEISPDAKISLDDKRAFAKSLYKITKEDLGKILVEVDTKCPQALTKNAGEDECELNVDKLSPSLFQELKQFVAACSSKSQAAKKKGGSSGTKRKST